MNCFSQEILYPMGGSPLDDYMTGVNICWELIDRLYLIYVEHLDNTTRFDFTAFTTEMAAPTPWLQVDEMDETGDEDGEADVYIIDAEDEMDIAYEMDGTAFADMGYVEAMDIVEMSDIDDLGDMEMVMDS